MTRGEEVKKPKSPTFGGIVMIIEADAEQWYRHWVKKLAQMRKKSMEVRV